MPLWRPDKNYVKGRRRTAQVREDVPGHHLRVLCQAGQLEVVPDVRQGAGRALDECGVRAPPAQSLDSNPAGASEKIQEAAAQKAGCENIEETFLRAVRDRTGIPRSRRPEPAALSRSCNNPHVKTRTLLCLTFWRHHGARSGQYHTGPAATSVSSRAPGPGSRPPTAPGPGAAGGR